MITYCVVGSEHPISRGELSDKVKKDLTLSSPAHATVLALDGPEIIGFFRYDHAATAGELCAAGTWVDKAYRKDGIARALWVRALRSAKPKRVWVKTVTRGGRVLVASLVRDYAKIQWTVV